MNLELFKTPIALALIAAIPGAIHGYVDGSKTSRWRGLSDAITALIFAVAVTELFTPKDKPIVALLIGLIAGRTGAYALDAIHELVPDLVQTLAMGWAKRIVGSQGMGDTQPMPKEDLLPEEDYDAEDARYTDED